MNMAYIQSAAPTMMTAPVSGRLYLKLSLGQREVDRLRRTGDRSDMVTFSLTNPGEAARNTTVVAPSC